MRGSKPGCGGTELESHLTLPGCFTCIHARKKRGLPPALNGVADSDLQVSGGLGGRGRGQGAGAGGTHAEPKKREGLAFKIIFLSPAGLN